MKTTEVGDRSRSWNRKRSLRRGLAENRGFSEVPTGTCTPLYLLGATMYLHVSIEGMIAPIVHCHSCLDRKKNSFPL